MDTLRPGWPRRSESVRDLLPAGSSSSGSEATATVAAPRRGTTARGPASWPRRSAVGEQQVQPGAGRGGGDLGDRRRRGASAGSAPARSRCRTSAHSSAESVGASRVSRSRDRQRGGERAPATPGQPRTTPVVAEQPAPVGERGAAPPRRPACRPWPSAPRPAPRRTRDRRRRSAKRRVGPDRPAPPVARPGPASPGVPADAEAVGVDRAAAAHVARRPGLAQQRVRRVEQQRRQA